MKLKDRRSTSTQLKTKIQAKSSIARPHSKSNQSQRLRLNPKLLLQIQQLTPNHRPVPVLEVWQPPLRKSNLTRRFPLQQKLSMKDIYATLNESYITINERPLDHQPTQDSTTDRNQEKDVIAAMYQLGTSDNSPTASSAIHFRDAHSIWQTITTGSEQTTPCYRFAIKNHQSTTTEQSRMFMQWEKRPLPLDDETVDNEAFVLLAIDRKARRKSRIATMNRSGFEITVRKSSILEHLRMCMKLTAPVSGESAGDVDVDLEIWLYTHVLTLGVWVASQEGWLH